MYTVFPLLQSCFLLYPFYCPLIPHFLFFTGESAGISRHPFKQITHLSRLCFEGPVTIIVGGVINLSSLNSPLRALSCLRVQIKRFSCEPQNIAENTLIKIKSVVIIIIIIIIAIATRRPLLHSHQSDAPQYIKTLDSTDLYCRLVTDRRMIL
jgi:hypothetical protein